LFCELKGNIIDTLNHYKALGESASRHDVYDLDGNYMVGKSKPYIPGKEQEIDLQIENLKAGIYLYILSSGGKKNSGRFIKVN